MPDYTIILPSKPKIVLEEGSRGVYEIENLYPGYGHTLGNSLRRIILSSLPGTAITSVKIDGANHEFSALDGIKEDVITVLLNLKKVHFKMATNEPQEATITIKGVHKVTAKDIKTPGQLEILNPDQYITEITAKNVHFSVTMKVEKGLGYISRELLQKDKVEIGTIALDAVFTPIRRVNYEVENMRVGERTDYNKLRISIETDGSLTPREALEAAIATMIQQLQAIVGFQKENVEESALKEHEKTGGLTEEEKEDKEETDKEFLKTRIDSLGFSTRTENALVKANIRTIGGLARKSEKDLLELEGVGAKGIQEIKRTLGNFGITLK